MVDCSRLQAEHQSFTLSQHERSSVIFVLFSSVFLCHGATLLFWYRFWCFWVGPLFTHTLFTPPSAHRWAQWTQPLSSSPQLGVTNFKAGDMNNQSVIFSFSTSCHGPDSVVFSISCLHSFASPLLSVHLSRSLQIADLYKKQQQIQNQGEKADPEDYYWSSLGQQ